MTSALLLAACGAGGYDDAGELAGDESTAEISQAQDNAGQTGASCTIEQCNGLKDPFGTLKCTDAGCTCSRGTVSGSCDAQGKNCKEGSCPPKDTAIGVKPSIGLKGGLVSGLDNADTLAEPEDANDTLKDGVVYDGLYFDKTAE